MKQQGNNFPKNPSFVTSIILFIVVVIFSSTPVIIEQMNRPERLLRLTKIWHIITQSTDNSSWQASDGFSANYVDIKPTFEGFVVILHPTELSTREAYFNNVLITKDTFKLSAEVNTPTACHNGIVFRGNEQGEYYLFLVSSSATYTVEILKRESSLDLPREAIIPNTAVPDSIGQTHNLAVIGKKDTYYFYINGTLVNQITDSRLTGNRVGVEAFT